jgi:uncharacterized protein
VVLALVAGTVTGCVLRTPLTKTFAFMPKPVADGRAHPEAWGFPYGTLDTVASTSDVRLLAWFIPSSRIPMRCGGALLLHGKGRNRTEMAALARAWSTSGFDVLVPDYRGYGGSTGEPTDSGVHQDAAASYRHLRQRMQADTLPLVVVGHSMGTALTARLARQHQPTHAVYLSPFSSASRVTRKRFGWVVAQLFDTAWFDFSPADDAREVRTRAVVAIAGRDLLIPRGVANEFTAVLQPAPVVLEDARATHNGMLSSPVATRHAVDTVRAALGCP